MKPSILVLSLSALVFSGASLMGAAACCPASGAAPAAAPARAQASPARLILNSYEKVSTALAADNLAEARSAARTLAVLGDMAAMEGFAKTAGELMKADSLEKAREQFKAVSAEAVKVGAKEEGYFIMNCPTGGKESVWVQSTREVRNPYYGSKALECGIIREGETAAAATQPAGRSS